MKCRTELEGDIFHTNRFNDTRSKYLCNSNDVSLSLKLLSAENGAPQILGSTSNYLLRRCPVSTLHKDFVRTHLLNDTHYTPMDGRQKIFPATYERVVKMID